MRGKILTVKAVDNIAVYLEEDDKFTWHIDMLEPVSITLENEEIEPSEKILKDMEDEFIEEMKIELEKNKRKLIT